ncbi:proteic killer suppression protein|uniref:Proteic killer suppression protein n=1 Tax=Brenneria salicis ATCC 15712 = DSM 30166 TaxID=714314 RepID=A0A366I0K1_9GAMM|nr:type II toxin-antitoxin system RelE/ParE family toxin [Brenneria salicis]NMN93045.1 proteic killer suppression protein [Brenneria salicis ATCC 15712 = DSM 30166]RBP58908.1 proteic killer suppression protein [Brenneria salicis ATCC 15712 = DSM 30166]RLM29401.1 Killer protein [Brenneria salicis ATCC 15712 = DSM 30166]
MIRSFKHKGLQALYERGDPSGVRPDHIPRLRRLLMYLDYAGAPGDIPGFGLHPLKGKRKGFWSASVSGNWRVTFRFVEGDVELIDYLDYH